MGLADSPESANNKRTNSAERAESVATASLPPEFTPSLGGEVTELPDGTVKEKGTIRDNSSLFAITLRNALRSWHRRGYSEVMDKAILVCGTDFQWVALRKGIMDVMNDRERAMVQLVNRIVFEFTEKEPVEQAKE